MTTERVIEGLRILPAYLEARRSMPPEGPPWTFADCAECRAKMSAERRQEHGCGYEPAIASPTGVWRPEGYRLRDVPVSTCAAYTTNLPVVSEVVNAHRPWKERTLTEYLDGEAPTRTLLDLLAVFEAGINEFQADSMRAASKGGK